MKSWLLFFLVGKRHFGYKKEWIQFCSWNHKMTCNFVRKTPDYIIALMSQHNCKHNVQSNNITLQSIFQCRTAQWNDESTPSRAIRLQWAQFLKGLCVIVTHRWALIIAIHQTRRLRDAVWLENYVACVVFGIWRDTFQEGRARH